ncbi:MAG: ATP-grasp domain-containing protein [Lachnospiraceae bacterium]|nr:ATP-grasp domain-containing protein [Lachnospiraceae bacterium]
MTRIWLNHWFSSAYNIINLIKKEEKDFYIIGSSGNSNSVVKSACDEWYEEPVWNEQEYVDYCLDFCRQHKVDIFMPRTGMIQISERKKEFEKNGTWVMADDYEKIWTLNQKDKAYELFKEKGIGTVPEYRIVTESAGFQKAYEELMTCYQQLCFKFVQDEGARSFRVIDNHQKGFEALLNYAEVRISYEEALNALSQRDSFPPVMVMPYMPGQEVSVDCLKTSQGVIMVPRIKGEDRVEKIAYDKEILDICRDFYEKVGLEHPCNIQFRYLDGIPYFLEVNTRMSGGVQMSCLASGINIPNIAVNKMLGREKKWQNRQEEKLVSYVEAPVIV